MFIFCYAMCPLTDTVECSGFPTRMMEVELVNVTEAITNLTERGVVEPVVKATIMLSESGFVSVTDAVAFGEIKDDSISGMLQPTNVSFLHA